MDKPNIAVAGTKHTVTSPNGRVIHKKCISKPPNNINQDCKNNRGTGPRGPDGRCTKSPSKARKTYIMESDNKSETMPPGNNNQTTPGQTDNATGIKGTFGRGKPMQKRERSGSSSSHRTPGDTNKSIGPFTITTNMTDTEINRAINDPKEANEELFIRDENNKVFNNNFTFPNTGEENSFDLDFANNLSSSTELETDVKHEVEKLVRRSKRLTKTNPIVGYNNPICHDYRNHRRKAELGRNTGSNPNRYGNKQPELNPTADNKQTSRSEEHCDKSQREDRLPVHKHMDHWRNHRLTEATQNHIGQLTANSEGGECRGLRLYLLISLHLYDYHYIVWCSFIKYLPIVCRWWTIIKLKKRDRIKFKLLILFMIIEASYNSLKSTGIVEKLSWVKRNTTEKRCCRYKSSYYKDADKDFWFSLFFLGNSTLEWSYLSRIHFSSASF